MIDQDDLSVRRHVTGSTQGVLRDLERPQLPEGDTSLPQNTAAASMLRLVYGKTRVPEIDLETYPKRKMRSTAFEIRSSHEKPFSSPRGLNHNDLGSVEHLAWFIPLCHTVCFDRYKKNS